MDDFQRIKNVHVTICDGLLVASKHVTDPEEFLTIWQSHGTPALREEYEDGIPYVTYSVEGTKWFLNVNLFARTLSELEQWMRSAA